VAPHGTRTASAGTTPTTRHSSAGLWKMVWAKAKR
jgi:hypothetical protein